MDLRSISLESFRGYVTISLHAGTDTLLSANVAIVQEHDVAILVRLFCAELL